MSDPFFGRYTIYDDAGDSKTPYMTRYWIGRLRLHIFHRGDNDPDCHDHPWDFWTFPLMSYVEEILLPNRYEGGYERHLQVVRAWRWSFRPAEHTHRILGRWDRERTFYRLDTGEMARPEWYTDRIVTIVWRSSKERPWGFLKNRDGRWCWTPWKEYFNGGKHAPCEPGEGLS